jgi:hypothetical protein
MHADQHAVGGLALAAVAGHGVTVIEMRMLVDVELNILPELVLIACVPSSPILSMVLATVDEMA